MATSNKTIAKNTVFLYLRMLLIMGVSLFTSRIILQQLGVEDFGIQNVVGGIVTTLSFLSGSIASGTSRYYAFYIGKKDFVSLNKYFKLSFTCYIFISIIVIILAETVGLWFVNTQLIIAPTRLEAANWVYQCSIVTLVLSMFMVPYQSMLIAFEKMSIYAYVGIAEVVLKLLLVYLLMIGDFDKLIFYSILLMVLQGGVNLFYILYTKKCYSQICKYKYFFEKKSFKEFTSYSVWIIFGAISGIVRDQGINILLNMFFGPVVNAARGVAYQVERAVVQFVNNFYMAARPQITKRYAAGEFESMYSLVFSSSRLCYYLILVLSVPIVIQAPYILDLWLDKVPENAVLFTRLVILTGVIESIAYALDTSITSTGKIRDFQVFTGGLLVLNLPVAYIFLKLGYGPEITMIVASAMAVLAHVVRMYFARKYAKVPMQRYCIKVLLVISIVTVLIFPPLALLYRFLPSYYSFEGLIIFTGICLVWSALIIYVIGMNSSERSAIKRVITSKVGRKK